MSNNLFLTFNHVPSTMHYYSLFMLQQHLEVLTDNKAFSTSSSQDKSLLPKVFNLYRQGEGENAVLALSKMKIRCNYENTRSGPGTNQSIPFFPPYPPKSFFAFPKVCSCYRCEKLTTFQITKLHLFVTQFVEFLWNELQQQHTHSKCIQYSNPCVTGHTY